MAGPFDINQEVNIFYLCVNAMIIFSTSALPYIHPRDMPLSQYPRSQTAMQSGFAFLEAGSVRSKNTTTILLKNCLDTSTPRSSSRRTPIARGTAVIACLRERQRARARNLCLSLSSSPRLPPLVAIAIGAVVYWATGWAFGFGRYGSDSNEFIGYREFFLSETDGGRLAYFFFEYTFACTSATIVRCVGLAR